MIIYLDESGDLGWTFDKPYRQGGSSRYLTIASVLTTAEKKHLPKRALKRLYQKHGWDPKAEKKWSAMSQAERMDFANSAAKLVEQNSASITYLSITVKKCNVQDHIRSDPNKLYNYMIGFSLLDEMKHHDAVTFIPDPRSVKVESGNSLHDYLETKLWFDCEAKTKLTTTPLDSSTCLNLQFADMLSGVVQGHFEDQKSAPWRALARHISCKTLFF